MGILTWFFVVTYVTTWAVAEVTTSDRVEDLTAEIDQLHKAISDLSRQVMLQQFYVQERIRDEGSSGVHGTRLIRRGFKNYDSTSHVSSRMYAIHDHTNYDRMLGMGEINAVMNGVEFKTRHNDYVMKMPSSKSKEYNALEDIPPPDVPPEVLRKPTVEAQIEEMAEWYRAFREQNITHRDYRPYFKPCLCFMEGSWTTDKKLVEPFPSSRHHLDANSWEQLIDKVRFSTQSGAKFRNENIAYLPTSITSIDPETGLPNFSQWTYRIICSPVPFDVPVSWLKPADDFSWRMATGQTLTQVSRSRSARFQLYDENSGSYNILDKIFATIPGRDNHGANLTMKVSTGYLYDYKKSPTGQLTPLNTAYYYRMYRATKKNGFDETVPASEFNDLNVWVAQNTQPRVAPIYFKDCSQINNGTRSCLTRTARYSYAFPIELIYMTPTVTWNPHNLTSYTTVHRPRGVSAGGDGTSPENAYTSVTISAFFRTPAEFYSGGKDGPKDKADTGSVNVWVKTPDGHPKQVSASGIFILTKPIRGGVGSIRMRYPIAPIHGEGNPAWKEINALRDNTKGPVNRPPSTVQFETAPSDSKHGLHIHEFTIDYTDFQRLLVRGTKLNVTTEMAAGHTHDLVIHYGARDRKFMYDLCDGQNHNCFDKHGKIIQLLTKNPFTNL